MLNSKELYGMWGNFIAGDRVIYKGKEASVAEATKGSVPNGRIPIKYKHGLLKIERTVIVFADDLQLCSPPSEWKK